MDLHLVRHAKSAVDPSVPPAEWALDPAGRKALLALGEARVLPPPGAARWFCSTEPKAIGTARALTDEPVSEVDALREMYRPAGPWLGDDAWRPIAAASMTRLDEPARPGWETGRHVMDRLSGFVTSTIAEQGSGTDLVLVGHGTAFTLLIAALTETDPDPEAWARIAMPDHCRLTGDPETGWTLTSPWSAWSRPLPPPLDQ